MSKTDAFANVPVAVVTVPEKACELILVEVDKNLNPTNSPMAANKVTNIYLITVVLSIALAN